MKKLSTTDESRRAELVADLNEKAEALRAAFAEVNGEIEAKLGPAIDAYNAALAAALEWRDQMVGDMESYADERSDQWRDGDAGQAYDGWKTEWEAINLDDIDKPEEFDEPDLPHADELAGLPGEPEQ